MAMLCSPWVPNQVRLAAWEKAMEAVLRIAEHQGDLCPAALGQP